MQNKRILITGHTGFQGYWLANILHANKIKKLYGLGLSPNTFQKDLFNKLLSANVLKILFIVISMKKKNFVIC